MSDDRGNDIKTAICEQLLTINRRYDPPSFIPPTAIDWIGDELTTAVLAMLDRSDTP